MKLTCYCSQSQAGNHVQVFAHFGQGNTMVTGIRFSEQWMRVRLIPNVKRTIEIFVVYGQVAEFRDCVGKVKCRYSVCR